MKKITDIENIRNASEWLFRLFMCFPLILVLSGSQNSANVNDESLCNKKISETIFVEDMPPLPITKLPNEVNLNYTRKDGASCYISPPDGSGFVCVEINPTGGLTLRQGFLGTMQ